MTHGAARPHLRRPRRPDPQGDPRPASLGRRHRERARRATSRSAIQAVSKHLKVLEGAGLITRGRTRAASALPARGRAAEGGRRLDRRATAASGSAASSGWSDRLGGRVAEEPSRTSSIDLDLRRAARARSGASGPSPSASPTGTAARTTRSPRTVSMDVREGGKWTAVMRGPEDHAIHWDGEYIEVNEPETARLHGLRPARRGRLRPLHRRAHRPRRARAPRCASPSPAATCRPRPTERAEQGWSGFFERIAERLAAD